MIKVGFFVVLAMGLASAQLYRPSGGYAGGGEVPVPYSFNYLAAGDEGQSSHQETGDGNGRVQGSYSLSDVDGRNRVVEYIADEDGFRAVVRTNEPGTASVNPADVIFESSAPAGESYYQPSYGGDLSGSSRRVTTTTTRRVVRRPVY